MKDQIDLYDDNWEYEDTDAYLYGENFKNVQSSWFVYVPIKSTSEYLRQSSGDDDRYTRESVHQTEEDLHKVLKELNKTINLTVNSSDGHEKCLSVRYSDGKVVNDLLSDVLYVSPESLLNEEMNLIAKDQKYFDVLDGLNGQALLCSFIKKDIHVDSALQFKNSDSWAVRNIFMTDLQSGASNEVFSKWPGFLSYVTQQMVVFGQKKKNIEEKLSNCITNGSIEFDDIVELLCFNRLSSDKIDYSIFPKEFKQNLDKADTYFNDALNNFVLDEQKFNRANKIHKDLLDMLEPSEGLPKSVNPVGEILIEKNNSSINRSLTGGDVYNNNIVIPGNLISNSLDHNKNLRERTKFLDDQLQSHVYNKDNYLSQISYKLVVPAVNAETKDEYKKIVKNNKKEIRDLETSFMFRNNVNQTYTHGTLSGDLDDSNFYKTYLEEYDKIYKQKDLIYRKKYHVAIALDQTGSMGESITDASILAIIMTEALKNIRDLDYSVYGFSTSKDVDTYAYKDKSYNKSEALAEIRPSGNTALGYHLCSIADKILVQNSTIESKIMFVITDGEPTHGSSGKNPVELTAYAIDKARRAGIKVYGIGVLNAFSEQMGKTLFGAGNFTVIDDVKGTLPILRNKLRAFLQRVT
jgi:hypothetical protein